MNQSSRASEFRECQPTEVMAKCAQTIQSQWMLLGAGSPQHGVNAMTISWGAFGCLWHQNLALVAVRQSRHTLSFIENSQAFSLSLFDKTFHNKLAYCGKTSGKDEDKIAKCQFTTVFNDNIPYFAEAKTVLLCRVMYSYNIQHSEFIQQKLLEEWYQHGEHKDNMHRLFFGAVVSVLQKN